MTLWRFSILFLLAACQSPASLDDLDVAGGNVTFTFSADNTRAACSECFSKLNVQVFNSSGEKVFDKIKTQTADDGVFGQMSLELEPGGYTIVAVGHSSAVSATIKSPQEVRFTASNGEKLTDTFCVTSNFDVGGESEHFDLTMLRATAMFRLQINDADIPDDFVRIKFTYTGGSANVNPSTLEGITRSTQTENRVRSESGVYEVFTFPYMSVNGKIKVTVAALDVAGEVLQERVFDNINIARNHITTYTGNFFTAGGGTLTQPEVGFVVDEEWKGEDIVEF